MALEATALGGHRLDQRVAPNLFGEAQFTYGAMGDPCKEGSAAAAQKPPAQHNR